MLTRASNVLTTLLFLVIREVNFFPTVPSAVRCEECVNCDEIGQTGKVFCT